MKVGGGRGEREFLTEVEITKPSSSQLCRVFGLDIAQPGPSASSRTSWCLTTPWSSAYMIRRQGCGTPMPVTEDENYADIDDGGEHRTAVSQQFFMAGEIGDCET